MADDFDKFEEITPEFYQHDADDKPEIQLEDELDELSQQMVERIIDKMMEFMKLLVGHELYEYQKPFARRIMESVIIGDGEEITALAARQCLDGDTIVFRRDGSAVKLRDHEAAWSTGVKSTKKYKVCGNVEVIATDNHPLMTDRGWVPAGELMVGDMVACLAGWGSKVSDANQRMEEQSVLAEYTIADGSSTDLYGIDGEELVYRQITSVENAGEREVFDVTYPGKGWFIAQGIQVHNSGKSETVADTVAVLMILLPLLAKMYPDLLGKFKDGFWVGLFAPTETQAETILGRTITRLSSPRALEILGDPEIDDQLKKEPGVTKTMKFKNSGSTVTMMTANPRAKIESKSFHMTVLDENQDMDDFVVTKSISPMLAFFAGTMVKCGTPTTFKNNFYRSIQLNKRRQTERGAKQNHFQWDWKDVVKVNPNYKKFIKREILRVGEESDEFQMSFNCIAPSTKILTADLRHIPAEEVTVGMHLVGFDEERPAKGTQRRLKTSVVISAERIVRPSYRTLLSDGTEVISSDGHQWLVSTPGRRTVWKRTDELTSFDRIFKITDVWGYESDYRTGYLAAAFDGEGHFSRQCMLGFSQKENVMMRKVEQFASELGFKYWKRVGQGINGNDSVLHVSGGRAQIMRFLGQVRPERLLEKVNIDKMGAIGRHDFTSQDFEHPQVVSNVFIGDTEVIALETSTKTFIAEGLASHNCKWLLERGMFVTSSILENLSDKTQEVVKVWHKTPVVVGIDPARKTDSTVVTVVWVDWDRPDEVGYFDHRILNWLEIQGDDWEEQYFQITNFLANYDVLAIGIDANGVGDAVAQRLRLLMGGRCEVIGVTSSASEQMKRYTHMQALIQRQLFHFPGHAKTRRLRTYKRFFQQMTDAEITYSGPNFKVSAPNETHAHDDYVDSASLALSLSLDLTMPEVQVSANNLM